MGYSTIDTPFPTDEFNSRKRKPGYGFKLCPYSNEYRDIHVFIGDFITGVDANNDPIKVTGSFVLGNSTNTDLFGIPAASYICSEHTTTSGRMMPVSNPPGWVCRDPNCQYKLNEGKCYTEV